MGIYIFLAASKYFPSFFHRNKLTTGFICKATVRHTVLCYLVLKYQKEWCLVSEYWTRFSSTQEWRNFQKYQLMGTYYITSSIYKKMRTISNYAASFRAKFCNLGNPLYPWHKKARFLSFICCQNPFAKNLSECLSTLNLSHTLCTEKILAMYKHSTWDMKKSVKKNF